MVKIIRGTYGYVDSNGIPQPKTSKDAPISLSKEEEARLVELGVAEYVDEAVTTEIKEETKKDVKSEKKPTSKKKSNSKKNTKSDDEEPPALSAADPE